MLLLFKGNMLVFTYTIRNHYFILVDDLLMSFEIIYGDLLKVTFKRTNFFFNNNNIDLLFSRTVRAYRLGVLKA